MRYYSIQPREGEDCEIPDFSWFVNLPGQIDHLPSQIYHPNHIVYLPDQIVYLKILMLTIWPGNPDYIVNLSGQIVYLPGLIVYVPGQIVYLLGQIVYLPGHIVYLPSNFVYITDQIIYLEIWKSTIWQGNPGQIPNFRCQG